MTGAGYHAVLAVKRAATGFRGIDGASPRSAGPLHLFHDPIAARLTAVRAVMSKRWAILPKIKESDDVAYELCGTIGPKRSPQKRDGTRLKLMR